MMQPACISSGLPTTRWEAVLLVVAAGVTSALRVGKAASGAPLLQADLGIGLSAVGWLTGIFAALGVVGGVPAGVLVGAFGARRLLIAGLLITAAGAAVGALSTDLTVLMASRVFEGAGFLLIIVAAPSLLNAITSPSDRDLAFALWSCFMPVGMGLAMMAGPLMTDWRMMWWASFLFSICLSVPALLVIPAVLNRQAWSWRSLFEDVAAVFRAGTPLGLAAVFALYSLMFFALFSFLPVLLMGRMGVTHQAAGVLSALVLVLNVFGNLAAGMLLSRGAHRALLLGIACLAMGGAGVGAFLPGLPDAVVLALCLLFSAAAGIVPATLLASAPVAAPAAGQVPVVLGLIVQGSNLGQILGPAIVGDAIEAHGWSSAAYVVAIAATTAAILAVTFRRRLQASSTRREARS